MNPAASRSPSTDPAVVPGSTPPAASSGLCSAVSAAATSSATPCQASAQRSSRSSDGEPSTIEERVSSSSSPSTAQDGSSHTMPGTAAPARRASATVRSTASSSTPRTATTMTGTSVSRSVTAKSALAPMYRRASPITPSRRAFSSLASVTLPSTVRIRLRSSVTVVSDTYVEPTTTPMAMARKMAVIDTTWNRNEIMLLLWPTPSEPVRDAEPQVAQREPDPVEVHARRGSEKMVITSMTSSAESTRNTRSRRRTVGS